MEAEYWLKQHVRFLHWARVRVIVAPSDVPQAQVSPDACMWLSSVYGPDAWTDVPEEFRAAAEDGAMYALAQAGEPFAVTVTKLEFAQADTLPDDVKFATAHAVWQAIGQNPSSPPYIDATGVHFTGSRCT